MSPDAQVPRTVELPPCHVCGAYASERLVLPAGQVLYVCEEHYDAWLESQPAQ
jgi:hypothetical protein